LTDNDSREITFCLHLTLQHKKFKNAPKSRNMAIGECNRGDTPSIQINWTLK
jgi:hypothetical protein